MTSRRDVARRALAGAGAALLLAGCTDDAAPDERPPPALPTPVDTPTGPERVLDLAWHGTEPRFTNDGSAQVTLSEVTLEGGRLDVVRGRDGLPALDFPSYEAGTPYPRAVLRIDPDGGADALSPGEQDFTWGADFRLDKVSLGRDDDNGDNLLQRGLSSQPALFKVELDKRRPACTLRGEAGEVIVRADLEVEPGDWYRVQCRRRDETVTVTVTSFARGSTLGTVEKSGAGTIGAVDFAREVPVTVGGKIGADGNILASASDQFNGLVMNPFVTYD